jgi:hypothetical protein
MLIKYFPFSKMTILKNHVFYHIILEYFFAPEKNNNMQNYLENGKK